MTSEYLAPTIRSSRRLFGPNLFSSAAGAVLDVACDSEALRLAVQRWPAEAMYLAAKMGWIDAIVEVRRFRELSSLFLAAPADGLLTASDLTEHAWVAAEAWARSVVGSTEGAEGAEGARPAQGASRRDAEQHAVTPNPHVVALLQRAYALERAALAHVVPMQRYAAERALLFAMDDERCTVGAGSGSYTLYHGTAATVRESERAAALTRTHNIPVVLVTGSNGKTTTTRLIAAMARADGRVVGWNCSDGVYVDGQQVVSGDFTGPGGALRVVADQRVQCAVLEAARGGLLRRGLAISRADVAVITNISADHFGEYGVDSLEDLAQVKAIVARPLSRTAPLILNADDPTLRQLAKRLQHESGRPVGWFTDGVDAEALACLSDGLTHTGNGAVLREGRLTLHTGSQPHDLGSVLEMPVTLGGNAAHNVQNALAAALAACVAGISVLAIRTALATFGAAPDDNPGRLMLRSVGGATVILDYAHNPEGIAALCSTASKIPAARRLLLFGQAGDRDDVQLAALADMAWRTQQFDRVVIKEMESMLRGRAPGEVPRVLLESLRKAGAEPQRVGVAASEMEGVREALAWARPDDLLVLGVHVSRSAVVAFLDQLDELGWRAGDPLPATVSLVG